MLKSCLPCLSMTCCQMRSSVEVSRSLTHVSGSSELCGYYGVEAALEATRFFVTESVCDSFGS